MLKKLAAIGFLCLSPMALIAQENQVKIVALVLTAGEYSPSSDNIVNALEDLNAQTLRAESANASELRSVLKRFAAAALENDVAIVFTDGPILKLGDREFLAPSGINLSRSSDLLTQAIPLSALARATALAGSGGAIFVHSADLGKAMPEGVTLAQLAPETRPGTSPVVLGQSGSAMALAELFSAQSKVDQVDLNSIMRALTAQVEFTVSYVPDRPLIIRNTKMASAVVEEAPVNVTPDPANQDATDEENTQTGGLNLPQVPVVDDAPEPDDVETTIASVEPIDPIAENDPDQIKPLTVEMLLALQSGLTRSEKRLIQRGLRDLGFYAGLIDGIFGNQTKISIESYQESLNAEITGVLSVRQLSNFIN